MFHRRIKMSANYTHRPPMADRITTPRMRSKKLPMAMHQILNHIDGNTNDENGAFPTIRDQQPPMGFLVQLVAV
jgi:hypothetical protein